MADETSPPNPLSKHGEGALAAHSTSSTLTSVRRMLILDFDGVMVDTEPLNFQSWNYAFGKLLGITLDDDPSALVGLSLEQIFALWAGTHSLTLTPELESRLLATKNEHYFTYGAGVLMPMPGCMALVEAAQAAGWYTAIVSRARRLRVLRTLTMLNIPALFDLVMGSEDAVEPITDRKIHARAGGIFGIPASDCVVIEDSASGVRDARACEIGAVIGFTSSLDADTLRQAGVLHIVNHLNEAQDLLFPDSK